MPYEDYNFFSLLKTEGPIDVMLKMYNEFCARWSAYTVGFYFARLYQNRFLLPVFHTTTILVLFSSLYFLIKKLFTIYFPNKVSNIVLAFYTLLFTVCFFFSSYEIGQIWFWYVVNWMYLWSIIAELFLFLILLQGKTKMIHLPLIIVLTAYIAGASESYAMIYIFLLTAVLYLKRKYLFSTITSRIHNNVLFLTLFFLLSFYTITIAAPGTWVRKDILTHATFVEHIIMILKAYGKVILYQTPALIPYLILFGLPWMLLGQEISTEEKVGAKQLIPKFIRSIFFIGALALIIILPASWVLYDLPPARALSQVSLLFTIYASLVFFYIGYKVQVEKKLFQVIVTGGLVLSVLILSLHVYNQYSITSKFSEDYDKRIKNVILENSIGRKNTLFFESLPPSGMIYSDELSSDSLSNTAFEKTYGLKFHVAVRK